MGGLPPASKHEIDEVAYWLVERFFKDSFQVLPDRALRESKGESYDELWGPDNGHRPEP